MVVVTNEPYGENEPLCWSPIKKQAPNVDGAGKTPTIEHAYRNITSSMQADPLEISSPSLALDLLSTALKLKNMPLVKQCIEILDQQLDPSILINVISRLSECTIQNRYNFEPSAPPLIESEDSGGNMDWAEELMNNLRHNCLLEIDKYADFILKDPNFIRLSYNDVLRITTRDTLQVSNETIVYSAIMKWANAECHRRTLQPHSLNIKAVLRDLVYAPRYGLMTKKEFQSRRIDGEKGPTRSGILEEKEWRRILFHIKEKQRNRPVEELPLRGSIPRTIGSEKPNVLSSKSIRRASCTTKDINYTHNRCDRVLLNVLTCWTAIFD